MTRDDIIRMAVQCQLVTTANRDGIYMDALSDFAALVAEREREECVNVCEELIGTRAMAVHCSDAIRARNKA